MKKHSLISILLVLAMMLTMLVGCGKSTAPNAAQNPGGATAGDTTPTDPTEPEPPLLPTLTGNDIFGGKRFQEMLWGYYCAENFEYTGSKEDSAAFRTDMEYTTLGTREVSVLPLDLHFGKYSHFMSAFYYEDEQYVPYTEIGRAMFRKAYMEQKGDLTEEDFLRIDKILDLDMVECTFTNKEGIASFAKLVYTVEGDVLSLYEFSTDDDYNLTISETPLIQLSFRHDGGKLTLGYKNLLRSYLTNGYKESDKTLFICGYALNADNKYENLEGLTFYHSKKYDDITVMVELSNNITPIDPVFELDNTTGDFTLSWEMHSEKIDGSWEEVEAPVEISGQIIPCTSYGGTSYTGFIMIVDGTMYKYLMSDTEYMERRNSSMEGGEDLSESEREELSTTKEDMLKELEKAFKEAGLDVSIDYDTGKVTLEASFLFDTGSYEISQEGKDYLDSFMEVYTSVVLKDEYVEFVSGILVEGHTDTAGSYSLNLELSQNRANAVAEHCIDCSPEIEDVIEAVGCSYDYPVYNEDGSVNMAKSRRVTFRFLLTAN